VIQNDNLNNSRRDEVAERSVLPAAHNDLFMNPFNND